MICRSDKTKNYRLSSIKLSDKRLASTKVKFDKIVEMGFVFLSNFILSGEGSEEFSFVVNDVF